ncbi:MAG: DUF4375 domain-containing protein [bacterium]|nr:DUF4375 domain-containing protein [bacterium]
MSGLGLNSVPCTYSLICQRIQVGQVEQLTDSELALFLAFECCSELCNGGFWQFFLNTRNRHTPDTIRALRMTGLDIAASSLERAFQSLTISGNIEKNAMDWEFAEQFSIDNSESFTSLEREWYESDECRQFVDILERFLEKNQDDFTEIEYEASLDASKKHTVRIRNPRSPHEPQ